MEFFTSLIAVLALVLAGLTGVFVLWLSRKLASTEKTSVETAGKLEELIDVIKKVGAGEGGETQLGPKTSAPMEGDKDDEGDLLWGDHGDWVEQERKKAGWKDQRGKAN